MTKVNFEITVGIMRMYVGYVSEEWKRIGDYVASTTNISQLPAMYWKWIGDCAGRAFSDWLLTFYKQGGGTNPFFIINFAHSKKEHQEKRRCKGTKVYR